MAIEGFSIRREPQKRDIAFLCEIETGRRNGQLPVIRTVAASPDGVISLEG
jgi:hypothetical protein